MHNRQSEEAVGGEEEEERKESILGVVLHVGVCLGLVALLVYMAMRRILPSLPLSFI